MKKMTIAQIEEVEDKELSYNKVKEFLHCKTCIDSFLNSPLHTTMSPAEYGIYEAGAYPFRYHNGQESDIVAIWCKRCGRMVWDSRHLAPMY